jgi:hypothetical protein
MSLRADQYRAEHGGRLCPGCGNRSHSFSLGVCVECNSARIQRAAQEAKSLPRCTGCGIVREGNSLKSMRPVTLNADGLCRGCAHA